MTSIYLALTEELQATRWDIQDRLENSNANFRYLLNKTYDFCAKKNPSFACSHSYLIRQLDPQNVSLFTVKSQDLKVYSELLISEY